MAEVGVQLNRAELRIGLKVLRVPPDVVESGVVAGHVQRDRIDIPVIQQTHPGRTLIDEFYQQIGAEFVLKAENPKGNAEYKLEIELPSQ